jgi:fatty-acyl-CoA synthase
VIERHDDANVSAEDVLAYLEPRIVKWWTPDAVVFDTVPLTATGKIDKKVLRERYKTLLTA